ncbi:uncharacterized protein LOC123560182 [Mercenaria mercenaria]|uniref:uncharacterized protein LOC123560182 n=1 Tax=Mercenaria mercenaria TaxID=6596 RepID=UPI00234F5280|nr:uncharacterized protein LOC123560182 [Mercenaria mercenaria]
MYNWLYYSASKGGYCCKVCELFYSFSPGVTNKAFIDGTSLSDHPERKFSTHDKSNSHMKAHEWYTSSLIKQGALEKAFKNAEKTNLSEKEIKQNREYVGTLITSLYYIIRNRWSLNSFDGFIETPADLECPSILQYYNANPTVKYKSSTSTKEILDVIDKYFEKSILEEVRSCDFYSILADESTDDANRTQFAVLIRCLSDGDVQEHLVGIINVKKTDAASLMDAIQIFLNSHDIDITKAVFCAFDGCNTMSGVNTGL